MLVVLASKELLRLKFVLLSGGLLETTFATLPLFPSKAFHIPLPPAEPDPKLPLIVARVPRPPEPLIPKPLVPPLPFPIPTPTPTP